MAYVDMAHIVMAYKIMVYIVMVYIVMVYIDMGYMDMALSCCFASANSVAFFVSDCALWHGHVFQTPRTHFSIDLCIHVVQTCVWTRG